MLYILLQVNLRGTPPGAAQHVALSPSWHLETFLIFSVWKLVVSLCFSAPGSRAPTQPDAVGTGPAADQEPELPGWRQLRLSPRLHCLLTGKLWGPCCCDSASVLLALQEGRQPRSQLFPVTKHSRCVCFWKRECTLAWVVQGLTW